MSAFSVSRPRAGAREWRERLLFLLLIGPNVLLLAAFTFWPMIYNAYLSTISWNFLSPIRRFRRSAQLRDRPEQRDFFASF